MAISEFWQMDKVVDLKDALSYLKPIPGVLEYWCWVKMVRFWKAIESPFEEESLRDASHPYHQRNETSFNGYRYRDYKQIMVELSDLELWINHLIINFWYYTAHRMLIWEP